MRRIVVGLDAEGRAAVVGDSPPDVVFGSSGPDRRAGLGRIEGLPEPGPGEAVVAELWAVDAPVPTYDDAVATGSVRDWALECPPGATRWRYIKFGSAVYAPLHRTDTLDYNFVLRGEVDLLLEDGTEVRMRAGDGVVIPGLVHGWRTGDEGCTKLLVMTGLASSKASIPAPISGQRENPARRAADAYIETINAGRYGEVGALFAPDAQWSGYGRPPQRGREAIGRYYREFLEGLRPLIRAATIVAEGDRCVVELESFDRESDQFVPGPVDHFTVNQDGEIVRFVVYAAPEQFAG